MIEQTIVGRTAATKGPPVNSYRKLAIAAGLFFLITDVLAIAAGLLYAPVLSEASYVTGAGADTRVLLGVMFEVIIALAVVGTAVALYPVARKYNEGVALGYVGLRTLEAGIVVVGVVPLLAVVTLRQQLAGSAGTDPATLVTLASALVAFSTWAFLVGPGLVCPANTVLMAYIMFRSRLVPRFIPVLGLIGAPLVFAVNAARMFGVIENLASWVAVLVVPIFAWEVTLALWLIFRGFSPSRPASQPALTDVTIEQVSRPAA